MLETEYTKGLKQLGNKDTEYFNEPSLAILETFPRPSSEEFYVKFYQDGEFTSLCPKTGQPDFADIRILYKPDKQCVESKSLKIYLQSYRNTGGFGEDLTNRIADDLFEVLDCEFLIVKSNFKARGGIGWITTAVRLMKVLSKPVPGCNYVKVCPPEYSKYVLTDVDKLQVSSFFVERL